MYQLEDGRAFAEKLRRMQETVVAHAGDWVIRHDGGRYSVSCYGNSHGHFNTAEEALNVVPHYYREKMQKQMLAQQLMLF